MPSKKIIFINRFFAPDESATSLMLTDLADALSAQGRRILIVTSRLRSDAPRADLVRRERRGTVEIHRVAGSRFGRGTLLGRAVDYLTFYLFSAWRLARLASRGDIVVVKTDPPLLAAFIAPVTRWRKAILVNWIQDLYPETAAALGIVSRGNPLFRAAKALRDRTLLQAAANVVIGDRMADRLRQQGVRDEAVVVIPNWADGTGIRPIPRAASSLRRQWALQDAFVVAYSGNMGRAHSLSALIDAAELAVRQHEPPRAGKASVPSFLLIGNGHQRARLEQEAHQRGLSNVVFKPFQPRERLGESLAVGDLHAVSLRSELEGLILPSKLYGILAAGRPVLYLGDAHGEIAGLLHRHRCGYRVPPDDPAAILHAIRSYAQDPERLAEEGNNARALFESAFSREAAAARWAHLLDRLKAQAGTA